MDNVIQIQCGGSVLADGSGSGGQVEDLRVNGVRVSQIVEPLRAFAVFGIARGQRNDKVSIRIATQWATQIESIAAVLGANSATPAQADLFIVYTLGGYTLTALLANAVWTSIATQMVGVTSIITYQVEGGVLVVDATESGIVPPAVSPNMISTDLGSTSLSAATTATLAATGAFNELFAEIDASAGSGPYTGAYTLATTGAFTGALGWIGISLPASANPTIEILNGGAGAGTLQTLGGNADSTQFFTLFLRFDGTNWRKVFGGFN